jgi:hypothetical protein
MTNGHRITNARHAKRWSYSRAGKLHDEDAYASGNQNLGLESSMSMHHTEMNSQLLRRFKENSGIDELPTEDLQKQLTMTARHQHEVAEKQLQHERAEKQHLVGHVQFGMCVPSN